MVAVLEDSVKDYFTAFVDVLIGCDEVEFLRCLMK